MRRDFVFIIISIDNGFLCRFKCKRCVKNVQVKLPPETSDCTSDLSQWYHCSNNRGLPDPVMNKAWEISQMVSFIFHHRSNSVVAEAKIAEEDKVRKRQKALEEAEEEKENAKTKKFRSEFISDDEEYVEPEGDDGDADWSS